MTLITARSHPNVHRALEALSYECGALDGWTHYEVPHQYETVLPGAESLLASLSTGEVLAFARSRSTLPTDDVARLHAMLHVFCENDWRRFREPA